MHEYIVEIDDPNGTTYFREGDHSAFRESEQEATHFKSYVEAVQHIAEILHDGPSRLAEPVQIHIVPVEDPAADDDWSIEDILRNAG